MGLSLTTISGATTIAIKLAEFFKVIDSTNVKVDKLIHNPFKTAIKELEDAKNASLPTVATSLLESARANFTKASNLEKNELQILALAGLAMCYNLLGDYSLVKQTINKIKNAQCDYGTGLCFRLAKAAKHYFLPNVFFSTIGLTGAMVGLYAEDKIEKHRREYNQCKIAIIDFCDNNLLGE